MAWYRQAGQKGKLSLPSIHPPIHASISPSPQALMGAYSAGHWGNHGDKAALGPQGAQSLAGVHRYHKATMVQCGQCWDRGVLGPVGAHGPRGSAKDSLWRVLGAELCSQMSREECLGQRHRECKGQDGERPSVGSSRAGGRQPRSPGSPCFSELPLTLLPVHCVCPLPVTLHVR